jgi:hypothetical protein
MLAHWTAVIFCSRDRRDWNIQTSDQINGTDLAPIRQARARQDVSIPNRLCVGGLRDRSIRAS